MSGSLSNDYNALRYAPGKLTPRRTPRVWTGLIIVAVMWIGIKLSGPLFGLKLQVQAMMFAPLFGILGVLIWWLGFSRFRWATRWTGLLAFILGAVATFFVKDPTMAMPMFIFSMPVVLTVWAIWTVIGSQLGEPMLRRGLLIVIPLAWLSFALFRMDGLTGNIDAAYTFRWKATAEQRYLASLTGGQGPAAATTSSVAMKVSPGDWPDFRGPDRDGHVTSVSLKTDWNKQPPHQLWKHLIGPGWSSFCVIGDHVYTQEQRGELEAVVCYQADTGKTLWAHTDKTRFTEAMAGPGPRATPTFSEGRLYSIGATGLVNCIDPMTGQVIWSRDAKADTDAPLPPWGFSGSPLVAHGLVTVLTGGKGGKGVIAYHIADGTPAWTAGHGWSYASPQLSKLDGVEQILYVSELGTSGVDPVSGKVLWEHSFPVKMGNRTVQPTLVSATDFLLGCSFGIGTRRVNVTHVGDTWKTQEVWTSRQLKPYYNDMVLHKGNLYGFDDSVLTCVATDTGKPRWRAKTNYGAGQVLLIADQDLLLVLSETGEACLVDAKPEAHHEIGRFQALEGKTWNHPVLSHGKLFVRNGAEAACYEVE